MYREYVDSPEKIKIIVGNNKILNSLARTPVRFVFPFLSNDTLKFF